MDGSVERDIPSEPKPARSALIAEALAGSSPVAGQSRTLPPQAYTSKEFFDLEMRHIFRKEWICIGHVSQLAEVGDYFTIDLFGELLVAVRGADRIRVMSRVCLHRWAPVATGSGNTKIFSCPFHKWGYALDGQLLGAPFMEQAEGFAPKDCRLPEVRSEIVEPLGLIFVTFDAAAAPIGPRLDSLYAHLAPAGMADMAVVWSDEIENDYNWKILIETFMECYHHIGAHKTTLEPNFPARLSYCEEDKGSWSLCHAPLREELAPEAYFDTARTPFSLYLVYPSLLMAGPIDVTRSDQLTLLSIIPLAPNRVRSRRFTLVPKAKATDPVLLAELAASREAFAKIAVEDNEVNDMQQLGAASSFAPVGRLSHLENSVWHLAEYVRRCLAQA
jgi:phenylpropionate dioxygenase-like ring-hydroxylating dioxygenase large terminal subunit